MPQINDFNDAQLGALVRQAALGREQDFEAATQSQGSLAEFFESVGLNFLAEMIYQAAALAWEGIKSFCRGVLDGLLS